MNNDVFTQILGDQIQECLDTLEVKADEYAKDDVDRLHNFRVAAKLEGVSMAQALGGMMAKHTVSVFDYIREPEGKSIAAWEEKITDHINYLLLLKAVVIAEQPKSENHKKDIS